MHLSETVGWLYGNDRVIFPLRLTAVNFIGRSPTIEGGDPPISVRFKFPLGRDAERDGRLTSLRCLSDPIGDGDAATSASFGEASKNGDAICASLREFKKDEAGINVHGEANPTWGGGGDCAQHTHKCVIKQATVPFEVTALVPRRDERLDWEEEKRQWIMAAGVSTPADLEGKLADMSRAAARNVADVKKLTDHVIEVKALLHQLHAIDKDIAKRKRRPYETSTSRRKRSRYNRSRCITGECCCALCSSQDSSTEMATDPRYGTLLDPEIMRSFRSLIKSSALN